MQEHHIRVQQKPQRPAATVPYPVRNALPDNQLRIAPSPDRNGSPFAWQDLDAHSRIANASHWDGTTVNHRQSVEIAALVSACSPRVIDGGQCLPEGTLEKFWDRSQRRLKLWLSALNHYQREYLRVPPDEHLQLWNDLEPVLEDIFVSEVLTRVWGAVLTAMDQVRGTRVSEPIARNVLIGHLDARKRALQLLVTDTSLNVSHLSNIDRIRRRVERWTDLLLGHLVERHQVDDFAFDPIRAREFGAQQLLQATERPREQPWLLLLVGLRMAFPGESSPPPHDLLQEEILAAILACFPSAAFPTDGPFKLILKGRVSGDARQPPEPLGTPAAASTAPRPPVANPISFLKLRNRLPLR